ncbi:MAG: hypothetical protein JNK64_31795 [Myxococcales bacterium]|nr:hypothetical protein [Myxococcales bacterium]
MRSLVIVASALLACKGGAPPPDAAAPPAEVERRGPGWRLRGDVLEDAGAGVRLTVPAGWRVLGGNAGLRIGGQVAVALVPDVIAPDDDDDDVYFAIDGNPIGDGDPVAHREALAAKSADEWTAVGDPEPFRTASAELRMQRETWGDPATYERLFGSIVVGGRYLEVKLQYPIARGDAVRPQLASLLAGLTLLDRAAHADLVAALGPTVTQDLIGPDFAYHDGVFCDFAGDYCWRQPPGQWRVKVITEPADTDPSQRLVANDCVTGTTVYVGTEAWAGTEAAYLDAMRTRIGTTTLIRTGLTRFGDRGAIVADIDVASTVPYRMRIAQARIGARMLSVVTDNLAAAWPGPASAIAAEAGVAITRAVAVDDRGTFRHRRAGVEVALPGSWQPDPDWTEDDVGIRRSWRRGDAVAHLVIVPDPALPPPLPAPALTLPGAPRPPTPVATTVDGHPATLTRRRGPQSVTETYLIDRAGTRIEWILTAPLAADVDDARHALRLIAAS